MDGESSQEQSVQMPKPNEVMRIKGRSLGDRQDHFPHGRREIPGLPSWDLIEEKTEKIDYFSL